MGTLVLKYGDPTDPTTVVRDVEVELPENWHEMDLRDQWIAEKVIEHAIPGKNGDPQVLVFKEEKL